VTIADIRSRIAAAYLASGVQGVFGYSITYTPKATGTPATFTAAVAAQSNNVENYDDGEGTVDLIDVTIPVGNVAAPVKYDTVTYNGNTYSVESVLPMHVFRANRCTCKRIDITENWAKSPRAAR
jgi:hypothetical protein